MVQAKAKAADKRHRYGQHYTPREVARLLAAFAVCASDNLVFDPACGDGRLLAEAIAIKQHLSTPSRPTPQTAARSQSTKITHEVFGLDRSAKAANLAATIGAQVARADFFDVEPAARLN